MCQMCYGQGIPNLEDFPVVMSVITQRRNLPAAPGTLAQTKLPANQRPAAAARWLRLVPGLPTCPLNASSSLSALWAAGNSICVRGICAESTEKSVFVLPREKPPVCNQATAANGQRPSSNPPLLTNLGNDCNAEIKAFLQIIQRQ